MKYIAFLFAFVALFLCSCNKNKTELSKTSESQTEMQDSIKTQSDSLEVKKSPEVSESTSASKSKITEDMAYEGINNYCHDRYDWNVAKDNPSIMYVKMGEETDSEYQVIFRSYTGSFVYFYVDKASGITRLEEYVPTLDIKEDAGTINLLDYIDKVN